MKKEEMRKVPKKNYVVLFIILLATLCLVNVFYMWSKAYQKSKLNEPMLDKYMRVINYNELEDYLVENPDAIIYVSVLDNEDVWKFEKKFEKTLKNNDLGVEMLYLNITEDLKDENKLASMKDKYNANSTDITEVPVIMIYSMGNLKYVYSIKENNYNVKALKKFMTSALDNLEDEING